MTALQVNQSFSPTPLHLLVFVDIANRPDVPQYRPDTSVHNLDEDDDEEERMALIQD